MIIQLLRWSNPSYKAVVSDFQFSKSISIFHFWFAQFALQFKICYIFAKYLLKQQQLIGFLPLSDCCIRACWLRNVVRATSTKTKFCQQKSIKHRCFGVVTPQLLRSPCLMKYDKCFKFSHTFVNWNVCIDQGNKRKEHRKIKKHNHSKVCTLYTIFYSMVIGSFHQSLTSYFRRVCLYHSYTYVL